MCVCAHVSNPPAVQDPSDGDVIFIARLAHKALLPVIILNAG